MDNPNTLILVNFHHGGRFQGPLNLYLGGETCTLMIERGRFNLTELIKELLELGYKSCSLMWYKIPGLGIHSGGLKLLAGDEAWADMLRHACVGSYIDIYTLHKVDEPEIVDVSEIEMFRASQQSQNSQQHMSQDSHIHTQNSQKTKTPVKSPRVKHVARKLTPRKKIQRAAARNDPPPSNEPSTNNDKASKPPHPSDEAHPRSDQTKNDPHPSDKAQPSLNTPKNDPSPSDATQPSVDTPINDPPPSDASQPSLNSPKNVPPSLDAAQPSLDTTTNDPPPSDAAQPSVNTQKKKPPLSDATHSSTETPQNNPPPSDASLPRPENTKKAPPPSDQAHPRTDKPSDDPPISTLPPPSREPPAYVEDCSEDEFEDSEDDDTAEDEIYKIDPRDMVADDDEMDVQSGKRRRIRKGKEHVQTRRRLILDANENNEHNGGEYDGGAESDNSVELEVITTAGLHYDDEELVNVRTRNLEIRRSRRERVGPSVINLGLDYTISSRFGPTVTNLGTDCNAAAGESSGPIHIEEPHAVENTDATQPRDRTIFRQWPEYWTTYEGGYESDQRNSGDEGPLLDSDEDDDDSKVVVSRRKRKVRYRMFNERVDLKNVHLEVGMRFTSRQVFKEAIFWYSIQNHKDLLYIKNDKRQIQIGCSFCHWELSSGPDLEDKSAWQIKSIQATHSCVRTFKNRIITENWLSNEYLDKILRDPKMKPNEIKHDMRQRYQVVVNRRMCQRAKEKALNAVKNLMKKQYGILKPYLTELLKSNPCCHGMSAILSMNQSPEDFVAKWYKVDMYRQTYATMLQLVPGRTFWTHSGEGMVLPPDIVTKKGRRKTARRKDPSEPAKNATKMKRTGLPTHCSRCGSNEHNKRKCPTPAPQPSTQVQANNEEAIANQEGTSKKRGRPKGSKNRIGRSLEDIRENVSRPSDYVATMRQHKGRSTNIPENSTQSMPWLETIASQASRATGRGRGRIAPRRGRNTPGRGRGRRGRAIEGVGVLVGERGQVTFFPRTGSAINISQGETSQRPQGEASTQP